jgi:hypothetical protein
VSERPSRRHYGASGEARARRQGEIVQLRCGSRTRSERRRPPHEGFRVPPPAPEAGRTCPECFEGLPAQAGASTGGCLPGHHRERLASAPISACMRFVRPSSLSVSIGHPRHALTQARDFIQYLRKQPRNRFEGGGLVLGHHCRPFASPNPCEHGGERSDTMGPSPPIITCSTVSLIGSPFDSRPASRLKRPTYPVR